MRALSFLLLLLCAAAALAAPPDRSDHPLLSAYTGSNMRNKTVKDYDAYRLLTDYDQQAKAPTGPVLEGKLTRMIYKNPKDRSVLEIFRNYEQALKESGADIVYQCDQQKLECAERYAQRTLKDFNDITVISNSEGRYVLGKLTNEGQTAWLAVAVGTAFTQIDVLEVKEMESGMVSVNAEMLGNGLDKDGYVIVEGIYFDTDKTVLKPESKPALAEVSKLLEARPELNLYVVGHTDMQGSLAHNMALSQGRAEAVVKALIDEYAIAANRLEGSGVGPLAPQASNHSDSGRAKNRRVVLVAR